MALNRTPSYNFTYPRLLFSKEGQREVTRCMTSNDLCKTGVRQGKVLYSACNKLRRTSFQLNITHTLGLHFSF